LSLRNLGGNLKGLEKGSLTGITSSRSLLDDNISGGKSSNTSRSRTYFSLKDLTNLSKVSVSENETNISTALTLELTTGGSIVGFSILTDALTHHGVLSHEDFSLSTESLTGLLELSGSYIVNSNDEALGVGSEKLLEVDEVFFFAFGGKRHI